MSLFLIAAIAGGVGLLAMAVLGMGSHGAMGGKGAVGHASAGHAGHAHLAALGHGAKATAGGLKVGSARAGSARVGGIKGATKAAEGGAGGSFVWLLSLLSPRVLFSVCFGFGVTGLLAEQFASFVTAVICGAIGGIAFEALLVGPLWRLLLRFSAPATTLDQSLFSTARAVTSFDKNGHGLVSLEVDGQVVQLLARLDSAALDSARQSGVRVHVGDELLVEEIDDVRQQCRVSLR
jgi:hypothetical protein